MHVSTSRAASRVRRTQLRRACAKAGGIVAAELVETEHGLALAPLLSQTFDSGTFQDKTGYEAWLNKIHVEDFVDETQLRGDGVLVQGLLCGEQFAAKPSGSSCVWTTIQATLRAASTAYEQAKFGL